MRLKKYASHESVYYGPGSETLGVIGGNAGALMVLDSAVSQAALTAAR